MFTPDTPITAFAVTKTVAEWAKEPVCRVSLKVLLSRLNNRGLSPEDALTGRKPRADKSYPPDREWKWSRHTGVTYRKSRGKWEASGSIGGVKETLGYFETEQEAIDARRAWERKNGLR